MIRWSLLATAVVAVALALWAGSVIQLWKTLGSVGTPMLLLPLILAHSGRAVAGRRVLGAMLGAGAVSLAWFHGERSDAGATFNEAKTNNSMIYSIAIGGGSTIDSGKAIAALMTNPGNPMDYLEVVGKGLPISKPPAPFIAMPTTAGTGAEATRNSVLLSEEHQIKVSMRSPLLLPDIAIVDPELTCSMPPHITAGTGLDVDKSTVGVSFPREHAAEFQLRQLILEPGDIRLNFCHGILVVL